MTDHHIAFIANLSVILTCIHETRAHILAFFLIRHVVAKVKEVKVSKH